MPYVTLSGYPSNALISPFRCNPLIGIIALESGYESQQQMEKVAERVNDLNSLIDFIWCIDGANLMTQVGDELTVCNERSSNNSWSRLDKRNKWNINFKTDEETSAEKILMRVYGFITGYLLNTTGKNGIHPYLNNYYFNNNIFEDIRSPESGNL